MALHRSDVKGAITPLVTPFHPDGVARPRVGRAGSSTGSSSAGRTRSPSAARPGEPTSQTVAERIQVMRAAVAAIDGRVPFLPGTGTARLDETFELTAEAQALGAPPRSSSRRTTRGRRSRACSTGTAASRPSSPTCRSSSTTCRSARRWTSRPRRSGGCAARTTTSSGSRRRRATSSTSPTCSTSAAPTSSRSRGSSCSATRCSRWAATATCAASANFAPEPGGAALRHVRRRATTRPRGGCTTSCTRSSTRRSRRRTRCRRSGSWQRMGILPSAFAREPLAAAQRGRAVARAGAARGVALDAGGRGGLGGVPRSVLWAARVVR